MSGSGIWIWIFPTITYTYVHTPSPDGRSFRSKVHYQRNYPIFHHYYCHNHNYNNPSLISSTAKIPSSDNIISYSIVSQTEGSNETATVAIPLYTISPDDDGQSFKSKVIISTTTTNNYRYPSYPNPDPLNTTLYPNPDPNTVTTLDVS
jgi:hypothetical protein